MMSIADSGRLQIIRYGLTQDKLMASNEMDRGASVSPGPYEVVDFSLIDITHLRLVID